MLGKWNLTADSDKAYPLLLSNQRRTKRRHHLCTEVFPVQELRKTWIFQKYYKALKLLLKFWKWFRVSEMNVCWERRHTVHFSYLGSLFLSSIYSGSCTEDLEADHFIQFLSYMKWHVTENCNVNICGIIN